MRAGPTDDLTHFQAAADQKQISEFSPVIPSTRVVDPRCTVEFTPDDKQDLLIESAIVEVVNETMEQLIQGRTVQVHAPSQAVVGSPPMFDDVAMPVPTERIGRQIQGHEGDSGLNQPAGQKSHLPPAVRSIATSDRNRLLIELVGASCLAAHHHVQCRAAEFVHLLHVSRSTLDSPW